MRTSQFTQAVVVLATASQSFAQTFSKCDPTKKTGCANNPALPASLDSDFGAATIPPNWIKIESQGSITKENGASSFIVGKQNDSPTADTTGYALFGSFSVEMKAAPGVGIVSSIVLESDNLDEVDWELIGGNNTHIQTNYFGKGDTSTYDRAVWHPIADPQANFHTYTVTWTQDKILWIIDDVVVRSLAYKDAKGGSRFPQTPMRLRLGSWAGGDPTNGQGTIEWAGGKTDFSKAPFAMVVRRVSITNYSPGKEYQWTDQSGSFDSIKVV
ncbi:concanavalin A-like lectin/glucanase, partial [Trichodelitschia bisporula]